MKITFTRSVLAGGTPDETVASTIQRVYSIATQKVVSAKFVVLQEAGQDDLTLRIGPIWVEDGYRHQALVSLGPEAPAVLGGGMIDFVTIGDKLYSAKFHDFSADYGVYDPRILSPENRQTIAEEFGIQINFDWHGRATPKPATSVAKGVQR